MSHAMPAGPMFVSRDRCISCGASHLAEVSGGRFGDQPLRGYIESDPWGENPMPLIQDERWSLVRCGECATTFHGKILSPQWNEVRFSQWMDNAAIREFEKSHAIARDPAGDVRHVLRLRDLGVRRVLDFGCGFADFLEMCRLFGMEAHGVDRSHARRTGAGVEVHAELADAPGMFDAITMFEVLEHLDDPAAMLDALKARLKPGGVMVIEVPDARGVTGITSMYDYRQIHPLDHINAFTPDSLVRLMSRAGFKPLKKGPSFVTTSPKLVIKDILRSYLRRETVQRYFVLA